MYMVVVAAPMECVFLQYLSENMELSSFEHIHKRSGTHFCIHTEFDVKIWVPGVFSPPNSHTAIKVHVNTFVRVTERPDIGHMHEAKEKLMSGQNPRVEHSPPWVPRMKRKGREVNWMNGIRLFPKHVAAVTRCRDSPKIAKVGVEFNTAC